MSEFDTLVNSVLHETTTAPVEPKTKPVITPTPVKPKPGPFSPRDPRTNPKPKPKAELNRDQKLFLQKLKSASELPTD